MQRLHWELKKISGSENICADFVISMIDGGSLLPSTVIILAKNINCRTPKQPINSKTPPCLMSREVARFSAKPQEPREKSCLPLTSISQEHAHLKPPGSSQG